ncbi:hypothetical protein PVAP13_1NG381500 [Panicum virgatum]|uniref:VAN3-binding protein-like auxin canalisation domain-containing protein n=1 Tax=Panicum virgatum TaxID=38727 RepID=A0A8T0WTD5_PANVG|nr:hypothetical protein PVAP13_1NG381500 [Panicum virgatum]
MGGGAPTSSSTPCPGCSCRRCSRSSPPPAPPSAPASAPSGAGAPSLRTRVETALASMTQLQASHCFEIAELAGADHDLVAFAVEAAVDVQSPSDLMTLTAATAMALRGATTLRHRAQREASSRAAVAPYETKAGSYRTDVWCTEGALLKRSRKGVPWPWTSTASRR